MGCGSSKPDAVKIYAGSSDKETKVVDAGTERDPPVEPPVDPPQQTYLEKIEDYFFHDELVQEAKLAEERHQFYEEQRKSRPSSAVNKMEQQEADYTLPPHHHHPMRALSKEDLASTRHNHLIGDPPAEEYVVDPDDPQLPSAKKKPKAHRRHTYDFDSPRFQVQPHNNEPLPFKRKPDVPVISYAQSSTEHSIPIAPKLEGMHLEHLQHKAPLRDPTLDEYVEMLRKDRIQQRHEHHKHPSYDGSADPAMEAYNAAAHASMNITTPQLTGGTHTVGTSRKNRRRSF